MEITYDYYRIFYYVARYKSFSKAAEVLHSNQPNISKFMNNLEGQLGCKLFFRSNRGVSFTPEGESLYAHVAIAYEQLRQAEMEIANDKSLHSGIVTIGASETALHGILLPVLNSYRALYPGVRLRVSNHSTLQALRALQNGAVDFAVVTTPTEIPAHFRETPLLSFHETLVASKRYAPMRDQLLTLAEVLEYPLVGLGRGTKTYEFYMQLYLQHGFIWRLDTEVATADQLLPMIKNDLGIGFVPDFLAREAVQKGEVVAIALDEPLPIREIHLVEDRTRHLSMAADKLKNMLLEKAER